MYLACTDPVLLKYHNVTYRECKELIEQHKAKPWWKRWLSELALRDLIRLKWQACQNLQDRRIAYMRSHSETTLNGDSNATD